MNDDHARGFVMSEIRYRKGDATAPEGDGCRIIAHCCNDIGAWGKGFVLAISARWKEPEQQFRLWYQEREQRGFGLGKIQLVQVEETLWAGKRKWVSTQRFTVIAGKQAEFARNSVAQNWSAWTRTVPWAQAAKIP